MNLLRPFQGSDDLSTGRFLRLLYEDMDDGDSLTNGGYIDGTGDAAFALHPHLPERTLQMLYIRFANTLKTVRLN